MPEDEQSGAEQPPDHWYRLLCERLGVTALSWGKVGDHLAELSPREIEHDNPEVRRLEEMSHFLSQLYNREVTDDDTVTVIRFSAIKR